MIAKVAFLQDGIDFLPNLVFIFIYSLKHNTMAHLTYVQFASSTLPGFKQIYEKFLRQMQLEQYVLGTITNYSGKIAQICLSLGKLPEAITQDEIDTYLLNLYNKADRPSKSMFEHTIYGLRSYYKLMQVNKVIQYPKLPRIRKNKTLPAVFSQEEVRRLLRSAGSLFNKTLLSLMYSCGLRSGEVGRIELRDVDLDRMQLHIRQGKGSKDRYISLGILQKRYLMCYMQQYHPCKTLFYGDTPLDPIKGSRIYAIFRAAKDSACIIKHASCHTLRHSYATHLLEMGESILQIAHSLGHTDIQTTLVYLHLTQEKREKAYNPLDELFAKE